MTDGAITKATTSVYSLLAKLKEEDRQKVVRAVLALLGQDASFVDEGGGSSPGETGTGVAGGAGKSTPKQYFDEKEPRTKIEELTVAARYRELSEKAEAHSQDQLRSVVTRARRNFDPNNFGRDIGNAKRRGLFSKATAAGSYTLSHVGQQYGDTLPDREALKKLRVPTRSRRRGAVKKGKAARKNGKAVGSGRKR